MRVMQCSVVVLAAGLLAAQGAQEGQALRFGVSSSVEATDNRDASETDKQSNVDVFVRPYVAFHTDTGAFRLNALYEPGLRYRSEPGDDQNETDLQHRFSLSLRQALSERTVIRLSDVLLQIEDPQISEGGAIERADRSYFLNTFRASLNYDLGRLSNVDLGIRHQVRRYDEDRIAILSDKDELGGNVVFRHGLSPTLRALVNAGYSSYSFEDDGNLSRDFDSLTGTVGLEYLFTPQVTGSLSGGMQTRSYDEDLLETDDNVLIRGELSGTLNPDLRVGATAGAGVRDADVYPYPSQEYGELRGYADVTLSPSVVLRGALTYRASTYDAYPQLGLAGGDEDVIVFDAQLTYNLTEMAALLAGHRYEDVSADAGLSGSFTRNTTRVGLRLDF